MKKSLTYFISISILTTSSLSVAINRFEHKEIQTSILSTEGLTQNDLEDNSATIEDNLDYKNTTKSNLKYETNTLKIESHTFIKDKKADDLLDPLTSDINTYNGDVTIQIPEFGSHPK